MSIVLVHYQCIRLHAYRSEEVISHLTRANAEPDIHLVIRMDLIAEAKIFIETMHSAILALGITGGIYIFFSFTKHNYAS